MPTLLTMPTMLTLLTTHYARSTHYAHYAHSTHYSLCSLNSLCPPCSLYSLLKAHTTLGCCQLRDTLLSLAVAQAELGELLGAPREAARLHALAAAAAASRRSGVAAPP